MNDYEYRLIALIEARSKVALRLDVSISADGEYFVSGDHSYVSRYEELTQAINALVASLPIVPLPNYEPLPRVKTAVKPANLAQFEHEAEINRIKAYRSIGRHLRRYAVKEAA